MRNLVHQLPTDDQVLGQTHIEIQSIQHAPSGNIIIKGRLGVLDADDNFTHNGNIQPVRVNLNSGEGDTARGRFDSFSVGFSTAPDVAKDPLDRFDQALTQFLDSEGWRNHWNLEA